MNLSAERSVKVTTILDFAPGDAVLVDFSAAPMPTIDGIPLETGIFVMACCRSSHQYAENSSDQTVET
jgi:hypothetical protein